MSAQRDALRTFVTERARGIIGITLLSGAVAATGFVLSVLLVWLLA